MSGQQYYESSVDRQIREAQERGDFDNLPGAGKPLDLGNTEDPDWWIKGLVARENLDFSGMLPGALGLRREASTFPESLADVHSEVNVREILKDFNMRVLADRLRPAVGNLPPLIAKTVDIDQMVEQWRALRAGRDANRGTARTETGRGPTHTSPAPARASWWRRLLRLR